MGLVSGNECVRSVPEWYMAGSKGGATAAAAKTGKGAEITVGRVRAGLGKEKRVHCD